MNKKIGIAMAALMVAALVAPAVMGADYTATVLAGQNTAVEVLLSDFGSILQGNSHTLEDSLNLTNSGGVDATVKAGFTTNNSVTWGLFNGSFVLPGNNFELGKVLKKLNYDSADAVDLTSDNNVPAASFVLYDAKLTVPSLQDAGIYSGTVNLEFGN